MSRTPPRRTEHIYAVLSGDIVGSTSLGADRLELAQSAFFAATRKLQAWSPDAIVGEPEFFRGDSWQMLLGDPRAFLRASLFLRAALRSANRDFDTRIGIGFGTVDRIDRQRISTSIGNAFTASGSQLDAMADAVGVSVAVPHGAQGQLGWMMPVTALCNAMMNSWSERQADIAAHMLAPGTPLQSQVAADLAVSKQMVSKTLASIDFSAIASALQWVEHGKWENFLKRPVMRLV